MSAKKNYSGIEKAFIICKGNTLGRKGEDFCTPRRRENISLDCSEETAEINRKMIDRGGIFTALFLCFFEIVAKT